METSWHSLKFQKSSLMNRSSVQTGSVVPLTMFHSVHFRPPNGKIPRLGVLKLFPDNLRKTPLRNREHSLISNGMLPLLVHAITFPGSIYWIPYLSLPQSFVIYKGLNAERGSFFCLPARYEWNNKIWGELGNHICNIHISLTEIRLAEFQ